MNEIIELRKNAPIMAPMYSGENGTTTITKIGGTYYEVTSHFSEEGSETVLQQFMDLLREAKIL